MPTYVCTTRADALDDDMRAAIAAAICAAHSEATGAPAYFAQVVFVEAPPGRRFLGGQAADDHFFVRGDIRAGRSVEARKRLVQTIAADVARIMGVKPHDVWVYLNELAPTDMIEYGHVLPPPGEERAWFDALPEEARTYLARIAPGRTDT